MFSEEVGQVFVPKAASFFFCGGGRAFGPDEKFLVVPGNVWGLFVFSEEPVVFSEALVGGL